MKLSETIPMLKGLWTVTLRDARTRAIVDQRVDIPNTFTNKGKWLFLKLLANQAGVIGAKHIAIGTDDGTILPLAATNTTLGAEIDSGAEGREVIAITTLTENGSPYKAIFSAFWDANTPGSNYTIEEIGLYGDSTMVKDDGYLVSRILLSPPVTKNTGQHTLDVDYTLEF
jgi:hypothetical protein